MLARSGDNGPPCGTPLRVNCLRPSRSPHRPSSTFQSAARRVYHEPYGLPGSSERRDPRYRRISIGPGPHLQLPGILLGYHHAGDRLHRGHYDLDGNQSSTPRNPDRISASVCMLPCRTLSSVSWTAFLAGLPG